MVRLDPAAPYLADHRPGGHPLLGTAASLEVLAEMACAVPRRIETVDILAPLIFLSDAPRTVDVVRQEDKYALASGTTRHLSCRLAVAAPDTPLRRAPLFPGPGAAGQAEIYRLFFHGPAFQVVAAAEWRGGELLARLASPLPDWNLDGRPALIAPRLIEFALQSAGLLTLAEQPEMAIPRHIARIDLLIPVDERDAPDLFAAARRGQDGIDIDLFDHDGRIHLRVAGYRTVPLPYPVERDRMEALHRALRR